MTNKAVKPSQQVRELVHISTRADLPTYFLPYVALESKFRKGKRLSIARMLVPSLVSWREGCYIKTSLWAFLKLHAEKEPGF